MVEPTINSTCFTIWDDYYIVIYNIIQPIYGDIEKVVKLLGLHGLTTSCQVGMETHEHLKHVGIKSNALVSRDFEKKEQQNSEVLSS